MRQTLWILALLAIALAGCATDRRPPAPEHCYQQGSNCGCSNYRKSQCGGECCKWYVGDGCGCR